jgi:hypothetical protein
MITKEEIGQQIKYRIQVDIDHFGGSLPERFAIAWDAYLAAMLEWQIITTEIYDNLVSLIPEISEPNPVLTIFLGREDGK